MKIIEFFPPPLRCSYLEDRWASFRYFLINDCEAYFYKGLLERGYRRFGEYFFVPVCKGCDACKTIRQVVGSFKMTRSHKRVLNKNANTRVLLDRPSISEAKLELYDRYHFKMRTLKGWRYEQVSPEYYHETFIEGMRDFGYELCYCVEEKLVGVGYVDILNDCISAIYFFYDHEFSHLSPGVFNILVQLEIAKSRNIPYFYPGYWIKDHHSLGYKSRFKPFEVLCGSPDLFDSIAYTLEEEK